MEYFTQAHCWTMVVAGGMGEGWTACADHGDVPELNQTDHLSMRTVNR